MVSQPGEEADNYYMVQLPAFTEDEQKLLSLVVALSSKEVSATELQQVYLKDKRKGDLIHIFKEELEGQIAGAQAPLKPSEFKELESRAQAFVTIALPHSQNKAQLAQQIARVLAGTGRLHPLLEDPQLEEVMVNGIQKPVYVFHRGRGLCKTNVVFDSEDELGSLIRRMAGTAGKSIGKPCPMADFSLPDGSRVNATLPPATIFPTITIRKFAVEAMTLPQLVVNGTLSLGLAAFLWVAVEGMQVSPMNIIIVGGAGSGKTTTLNALGSLASKLSRIISVEDTPELNIGPRDNWVRMSTYYDYMTKEEISMDDLLKNSLRMRPDRIFVGEVRGKEAETLFVAMDVGCAGSMGTLHANNAREALLRLQSPPMSVPAGMLPLLDLIVVQHRFNWPGKGLIRRITSVSEVDFMGEKVTLNDIFKWDKKADSLSETGTPSQVLERLAFGCGLSKSEVMEEIRLREALLKWMVSEGITSFAEVDNVIQSFYTHREKFLEQIKRQL